MAVDQRLDLLEVPDRLRPADGVGLDDPTGIVGVNDAVPAAFSSASTVDFPLPDMPVTSTTDRLEAPSLCSAGLSFMPITA